MQQHLAAGCRRCASSFKTWDRVRRAAVRESQYQAPESVVRHVQNTFIELSFAQSQGRTADVPRLVFDSLWQPSVAGVRSTTKAPRQVLYRLGDIAMEMRLEPVLDSELVNITGQISLGKRRGESLAGISVVVGSLSEKLAETQTNEFGEFQLTYLPEKGTRIVFGTANHRDLSVPLDGGI
jgi:hypothetical protein